MAAHARRHILILGGGFGGLYTAKNLQRKLRNDDKVEVTLVSRDNFFVMTPLLFEASSGILDPRHAVASIRTYLRKVNFLQAEIERIDLDARKIIVRVDGSAEAHDLAYDQLVIALGGTTNTRLVPGAADVLTFKTMGDAIFVRNHCIQRFERADVETDPARKRAELTFIVIGAGFVGVELAGELSEFLPNISRAYHNVSASEIRLVLIEAGPRVAPEFDEKMATYIVNQLTQSGVEIRVSTPVERIEHDRVILKGGESIMAETITGAMGVTPSPLVQALPVEKSRKGAIVTDAELRVKDHRGVWAIGDCASIPSPDGHPYPPLAQHALREAKVLAHNITTTLRGGTNVRPFIYETKGLLASLGHHRGVGRIGKLRVYGFIGWWLRRSYYLFQMPQISRRVRIVIDWTVQLFFHNDVVQLDLQREKDALRMTATAPPAVEKSSAAGALQPASTHAAP
jgi:NADH:ubiquinone reductase (H+-translocating)